jgi:hypothetical protein
MTPLRNHRLSYASNGPVIARSPLTSTLWEGSREKGGALKLPGKSFQLFFLHCFTAVPSHCEFELVTSTRLKMDLLGLTWIMKVNGFPLLLKVAVPVPSASTLLIVKVWS